MITQRPLKKQNLCLDKGYDYLEIEIESIKRRYIPHIRHRGENKELIKHGKYYPKRRWVVERTNSWHNRFRKLLVRYEKKSENYLALVSLACCIIIYRRIGDRYNTILPKVKPALISDLLLREIDYQTNGRDAPMYTVEVFTRKGIDSEEAKMYIIEKTGMVPSIYDHGIHYVTNQRLTLEILQGNF